MSRLHFARMFVLLAVSVGWSGVFLLEALDRWRFERICAMTCGPFWEVGTVELIKGAMDWHTPLTLAALPPLLWGAWSLRCGRGGLMRRPLDPR